MRTNCCPGCQVNFTFGGSRPRSSLSRRPNFSSTTRSPLLLRCGHTFCEICVAEFVKKRFRPENERAPQNKSKGEVICPLCKVSTPVPNGVQDLPVNIYLAACIFSNPHVKLEQDFNSFIPSPTKKLLQEALSEESKIKNKDEKGVKLCSMCEDEKASCECKDCENIYCSSCFKRAHKISAVLRHHQPVALEQDDELNNNREVTCKDHNRPIEYFCKSDNTRICSRCFITGDHKQHDIQSFEEKNIEYIDKIDKELPKANKILSCLKKMDKRILAFMPTFKSEAKNVIEEISASFLYLHSLLQVKEREMLEKVCKNYDNCLEMLENKRKSTELSKHRLDITLKEAKRLSDNSSLIVDAEGILNDLTKSVKLPCMLADEDSVEEKSLKWDTNGKSEVLTAINSFGDILGDLAERVKFKTFEESPLDFSCDDDAASVCSVASTQSNVSSRDSFRRSSSIISDDAHDSDADNCRTRSSKTLKEVIAQPTVKGPPQKIIITHIISPSIFYVQLANNKTKLNMLSQNMNSWCSSGSSKKHQIPMTLERDMLVLAKYSLDKSWYRARVISVEDPSAGEESKGFEVSLLNFFFIKIEKMYSHLTRNV